MLDVYDNCFNPQVIHGNVTLDEFMSSLMSANESYQSQLSVEKWVKETVEYGYIS